MSESDYTSDIDDGSQRDDAASDAVSDTERVESDNESTELTDDEVEDVEENVPTQSSKSKTIKFSEVVYENPVPRDIPSDIHVDEMKKILLAEVDRKGIAGSHIESMNIFYSEGIQQIITKLFKAGNRVVNQRDSTEEDRKIRTISFDVTFEDVRLLPPTHINYTTRQPEMLVPNMARKEQLTYHSSLEMSAKIVAKATLHDGTEIVREDYAKQFQVTKIPVMVKSNLCHLYTASHETIRNLQDDPLDPGGYFIIKGTEWCVDHLENMANNYFQVYRNMFQNEIARGDFISKPGDAYENSFRILMRYLMNGGMTMEIQLTKTNRVEIPFFIVYRAFGMTRDSDIVDTIVYDRDSKDAVTVSMLKIIENAFRVVDEKAWGPIKNSTVPLEIINFIAPKLHDYAKKGKYKRDESAVKHLVDSTTTYLDKHLFPHIGTDPASRIRKLQFFGHCWHKLLRVEMGVLDGTDRDNYKIKRVHSAGVTIAKSFKTQFNFSVVQEIIKRFTREFKSKPFSQVNLADSVRQAFDQHDLEKLLLKSIVTGEKTLIVKKREVANRVSSQQLYRKNDLNVKSTLNTVNTATTPVSKSNERADEMRRVHPSTIGFICAVQSAESGEKVGMSKNIAISASVCSSSNSYDLKHTLKGDPLLIDIDDVTLPEIMSQKLTKVFVNGDWIGLCRDSDVLVRKYRTARRHNDIDWTTSVVWEESVREVYFWVDVGRFLRPLVIVYNNIEEYVDAFKRASKLPAGSVERKKLESVQFRQWILLTKQHLVDLTSGKITITDLRRDGVLEYISPEEQLNALIAENITVLREHAHNCLRQYTHVDIDQAPFGLIALSSPNANHTAPIKVAHYTSQKKQTCGWFALNWPFRIDKNTYLQYYVDMPIASTMVDNICYPTGQNVILAITCKDGRNMEDSSLVNSSAIDRGMFNGCHFQLEKTIVARNETVGPINHTNTMDIKKSVIYEHIDANGLVRVGTVVRKGHVLISKYAKLTESEMGTDKQFVNVDRSVWYKGDEPAIVDAVERVRDADDQNLIKIKLRVFGNLQVGDKLNTREGNKTINAIEFIANDGMYSEDGLIPDVVTSPFSIPTRMCIGQIMEMTMCEYALQRGGFIDATMFVQKDIPAMIEWLDKNAGIKYGGCRRMYDGKTGNFINALIFIGNCYMGRLNKHVANESYAVNTGPTSAATRQPLDGKANDGGMRIGEMEKDVYMSHGETRAFGEKFYAHSDGIRIPVCRNCRSIAIVNERHKIYKCNKCKDMADISWVHSSWMTNVLLHEFRAMGLELELELEPYSN